MAGNYLLHKEGEIMINKKALQAPTPVRFSKAGLSRLDKLTRFHGTTRSDVIRQLVHNEYESLKGAKVIK